MNFNMNGTKVQPLYILEILKKNTDRDNFLTKEKIAEKLRDEGYCPVRKDKNGNYVERNATEIKSISKDLNMLLDLGFKIHGLEPEIDEETGEEIQTRGKIWIEGEISDGKLSWLMNSIKYNAFMDQEQKKDFMQSIISLGSKTFQEKNNAKTIVDGGRIFHVEGASLFKQLSEIDKAITRDKKIRFTYSKLKRSGSKFVYESVKEYTVTPYWVIVNNGNTYLVCYNHEENKIWHARVDRMKDVKMINSYALPKTETELKGIDVGDYVTKHPLMFSGDSISVELKIDKNQISRLVEAFGTNFSIIKETEDYLMVKVCAGELDMFHWAIQYGGFVEILKPQKLRDEIRYHIECMMFNYFRGDGDRYTEAIRLARSRKILNLEGIDLRGKTKHLNLKNVRTILLSNNNVDNVDFIKNMPYLRHVCIKNNPITDLSALKECKSVMRLELENLKIKDIEPIADLPIETLYLGLGRTENLSAVYKLKKLKWLKVVEECAYYNDTLSTNWDEFDKRGIHTYICDRKDENVNHNDGTHLNAYYPYNLLKNIFGRDNVWVGNHNEISLAVDKFIEKFTDKEKAYLDLIYKQRVSDRDARKTLALSDSEIRTLHNDILRKFRNPIFTDSLEKFIQEEDYQKNYSLSETIKRKEETQKNFKN